VQCIPHILSTFKDYGKLSGFKINWQKLALLPLNPLHPFQFLENLIYLGIDIYSSVQTIAKNNLAL